jgi:hypothetical protein
MSTLCDSASGTLQILRSMWSEHCAAVVGIRLSIATGSVAASSGRTHLPSVRRSLSAEHPFLRPVWSKHDLTTDNQPRYAYNNVNRICRPAPEVQLA